MVLSSTFTYGGKTLKIDNTPTAIVASVGILGAVGLVVALIFAGWSSEAIIGFGTLALGLVAGQATAARKAATIEAKTDHQTEQLTTIASQTDGELRQAIADAVADGIERSTRYAAQAYGRGRDDEAAGSPVPPTLERPDRLV